MKILGYQICLGITRFVILVIRPDYQKFCLRSTPGFNPITLGEELMSAISEERRKAWQTMIESTDMTHTSKKAWPTIRKLCDDPCKPKQHCNTTANQVAHQVLHNGRVPNRQPRGRLDRHRYPEDPGLTRAFTAAELDIGTRVLNNGKTPCLDDIQTELIKQLDPRHATGYFVVFNNCTETKKIP